MRAAGVLQGRPCTCRAAPVSPTAAFLSVPCAGCPHASVLPSVLAPVLAAKLFGPRDRSSCCWPCRHRVIVAVAGNAETTHYISVHCARPVRYFLIRAHMFSPSQKSRSEGGQIRSRNLDCRWLMRCAPPFKHMPTLVFDVYRPFHCFWKRPNRFFAR